MLLVFLACALDMVAAIWSEKRQGWLLSHRRYFYCLHTAVAVEVEIVPTYT